LRVADFLKIAEWYKLLLNAKQSESHSPEVITVISGNWVRKAFMMLYTPAEAPITFRYVEKTDKLLFM